MTKPNHLEDSALPPTKFTLGAIAEQRDVLAKVYRLLLTLRDEKTKNQTSSEGILHGDKLVKPVVELLDE